MFLAVEGVAMGINFVQADIPSVEVAKGFFIPKVGLMQCDQWARQGWARVIFIVIYSKGGTDAM